jgi:hypothetical protein
LVHKYLLTLVHHFGEKYSPNEEKGRTIVVVVDDDDVGVVAVVALLS